MAKTGFNVSRVIQLTNQDYVFQPLVTLATVTSALTRAGMHHIYGKITDGNMHIACKAYQNDLGWDASEAFDCAMIGRIPESFEIVCLHKGLTPKISGASTSGFSQTLLHLCEPIFLAFFEPYSQWLKANLGDGVNWGSTLNFARVVRNAVAHGAINIRNPGAPPVEWCGLRYSHASNGRRIIGSDLSMGDLIALTLEINNELAHLKAPLLSQP